VRLEIGMLKPRISGAFLRALAEKGAKGSFSIGRVMCWQNDSPQVYFVCTGNFSCASVTPIFSASRWITLGSVFNKCISSCKTRFSSIRFWISTDNLVFCSVSDRMDENALRLIEMHSIENIAPTIISESQYGDLPRVAGTAFFLLVVLLGVVEVRALVQ
jgi:hypothetical protein